MTEKKTQDLGLVVQGILLKGSTPGIQLLNVGILYPNGNPRRHAGRPFIVPAHLCRVLLFRCLLICIQPRHLIPVL